MFRNVFIGLLVLAPLGACAESGASPKVPEKQELAPHGEPKSSPDAPPKVPEKQELAPHGEPKSNPGGSSGTEGSMLPCAETGRVLESRDTVSELVGVSAADLLELANRRREIPLRWNALDSGPSFERSATTLMLEVTAGAEPATEYVCRDPMYPEKYRSKPRVALPVVITLRTADGVLDERLSAELSSTGRERAEIESITLELAAVGGSIGQAVDEFYDPSTSDLLFHLGFGPSGAFGSVMGPFSPHKADPCLYTTYAYWPAESGCWPERVGQPIDDSDVMQPHLARVNRSFELTWNDAHGERTEATFQVELAEGATCAENGSSNHPVNLRITSADGRIDLALPALLEGGPSAIEPWPAKLRDVEPFALGLIGSIALDTAALTDQLGITAPGITAAIVSVYLSSPVGVDSPVLSGMLRVVPIERTGFATPLPTVQLPGGDSERCFSSIRRTSILVGTIAQR